MKMFILNTRTEPSQCGVNGGGSGGADGPVGTSGAAVVVPGVELAGISGSRLFR